MGDKDDYLTAYRVFFEKFAATVDPKDQLPVNIAGYTITQSELPGEVLYWTAEYLSEIHCPPTLMTTLRRIVLDEVLIAAKKHPDEHGYDSDKCEYEALRLMQAVTSRVNDVCLRYLDNARLDTLPPPPPISQRGYRSASSAVKNLRRVMEDRHVEISNLEALFGIETTEPTGFYAVYDGHAGSAAATYCAAHLHQYLVESPYFKRDLQQALYDAFVRTDAEFVRKSHQKRACGGSTAVVVCVRGGRLAAAWAGDSLALLVKRMGLMQLVNPHKPDRPDETLRIQSSGGIVMHMGTWRVNGQLAVSRAIGNAQYKPYVTAQPEIAVVELDGDEDFVVVACDGLWDVVSEDAVAISVYDQLMRNPDDVKAVTSTLVRQAKEHKSQDNITVIVVFLKDPRDIAADCPPMDLGLENAVVNPPPFAVENEACKVLDGGGIPDNGVSDSDSDDLGPETAVDQDLDMDENQEQAPPTPPVNTVDSSHVDGNLVDNVAESGEESEDEWNYYKGEGEREREQNITSEEAEEPPRSDTPCQDNSTWESSSADMNSSPLNPDAPVFVPGGVAGSDVLLAESPRKPLPMDDIELVDEQQFQTEAVIRPAELQDCELNGHHNISMEGVIEHPNGDKNDMDSLGFGFNVGIDQKQSDTSFTQEFERIQKDTTDFCNIQVFQTHTETNPFSDHGDDELFERLKNKERDPMSMSFYQEKDDDTCERFGKIESNIDLNAVQPLPESDDEDIQQNGICLNKNEKDKENLCPEEKSGLFSLNENGDEPNNDILRFDDRSDNLAHNVPILDNFVDFTVNNTNNMQSYNTEYDCINEQETVAQTDTPESHKLLFEQIPEIPDGKSSELGFTNEDLLDPSESENNIRAITPQDEEISQNIEMEMKLDEVNTEQEEDATVKVPEIKLEAEDNLDTLDNLKSQSLTQSPSPVPSESPLPHESSTFPAESPLPQETSIPQESSLPRESPMLQESSLVRESPLPLESPIPQESSLLRESPLPQESSIPRESPLMQESLLPRESPVPQEPLLRESPLIQEISPRDSPLPQDILQRESPVPQESPLLDGSLPRESPLPQESLMRESPLPQESLLRESPLPQESLPRESPLPQESLPRESPLPQESLPRESPLPQESLPRESPLPQESLPRESPLPQESILRESPLPQESLPRESPLPQESLLRESPLPQESLLRESPLPESTLLRESPLPQESLLRESPLSQESLPRECPLPEESLPLESPLPQESLRRESPLPEGSLPRESPILQEESTLPVESPVQTEVIEPISSPLPTESCEVVTPLEEKETLLPVESVETAKSPMPSESPVESPVPLEAREHPVPAEVPLPRESPLPSDSPVPEEKEQHIEESSVVTEEMQTITVENITEIQESSDMFELKEELTIVNETDKLSPVPDEIIESIKTEILSKSPLPEEQIEQTVQYPLETEGTLNEEQEAVLLSKPVSDIHTSDILQAQEPLLNESNVPVNTDNTQIEMKIEPSSVSHMESFMSSQTVESSEITISTQYSTNTAESTLSPAPAPEVSVAETDYSRLTPEMAQEAFALEASESSPVEHTTTETTAPAPDLLPDERPRSQLVTDIDIGIPESRAQEICVPVTSEIQAEEAFRPGATPPPTPAVEPAQPALGDAPIAAATAAVAAVAAGVTATKAATVKKSPTTPTPKIDSRTPKTASKTTAAPRSSVSATKKLAPSPSTATPRSPAPRTQAAAAKASPAPKPSARPASAAKPTPKTTAPAASRPAAPKAAQPGPPAATKTAAPTRTATAPRAAPKALATKPAVSKTAPPKSASASAPRTTAAARPASTTATAAKPKETKPKAPAAKPLTNGDVKPAARSAARPATAPAARPATTARPAPRSAPRPAASAPPSAAPIKSAAPKPAARAPLDKQSKDLANKRITAKAAPPRTTTAKAPSAVKSVPRAVKKSVDNKKESEPAVNGVSLKAPPSPPLADTLLPDVIA